MMLRYAYLVSFPARGFVEDRATGLPRTYARRSDATRYSATCDPHGLARIVAVAVYAPGEHPQFRDNGQPTYVVQPDEAPRRFAIMLRTGSLYADASTGLPVTYARRSNAARVRARMTSNVFRGRPQRATANAWKWSQIVPVTFDGTTCVVHDRDRALDLPGGSHVYATVPT